jgi:hypothetical protein
VNAPSSKRGPRIFAALALLALAATYLCAQIDFARRHRIAMPPARYWLPQLRQIWLPGCGLALVLGAIALVLHRRGRRA